jgi:hypothetical protein
MVGWSGWLVWLGSQVLHQIAESWKFLYIEVGHNATTLVAWKWMTYCRLLIVVGVVAAFCDARTLRVSERLSGKVHARPWLPIALRIWGKSLLLLFYTPNVGDVHALECLLSVQLGSGQLLSPLPPWCNLLPDCNGWKGLLLLGRTW